MASLNTVDVKLTFTPSRVYGWRMKIATALIWLACRIATAPIGHIEIGSDARR